MKNALIVTPTLKAIRIALVGFKVASQKANVKALDRRVMNEMSSEYEAHLNRFLSEMEEYKALQAFMELVETKKKIQIDSNDNRGVKVSNLMIGKLWA